MTTAPDCSTPFAVAQNPLACMGEAAAGVVSTAAQDGLQELANQITAAVGEMAQALSTMWVYLPTPDIASVGGEAGDLSAATQPFSAEVATVLGWVTGIAILLAVASMIVAGIAFASRRSSDEAHMVGRRVALIAATVAVVCVAGAAVSALLPHGAALGTTGAVAFTQNATFWLTAGIATLAVIVGCIRVFLTQRKEPLGEILRGMFWLIAVSVAAVPLFTLLTRMFDEFSIAVLGASNANCDTASTEDACFGENITSMLQIAPAVPLGVIGTIVLGVIALLAGYVQLLLMVLRIAVLVLLAGLLPLAASGLATQQGRATFGKVLGWMVAFLLYKPAAAIIYALAFTLTGSNVFRSDGSGLLAIIIGIALLGMAVFALPALLRLVTPLLGAVSGGSGMAGMAIAGAAGGGLVELATGAIRNGGAGAGGGKGAPGGGGSAGQQGPAGATGAVSAAGAAGPTAGAASGAAGGGAAAAGGGAAAGAAGGPWGAAAGVAVDTVKRGVGTGVQAARGMTAEATGSQEPEQK